jgi:hypothetical protein
MACCRVHLWKNRLQIQLFTTVFILNILMFQTNQPTSCNNFTSLLLDIYMWLNMFRAPLRPSSGAYNCTRSLWFYCWSVAVGVLLVVVWQVMRMMMGGEAPETCWATHKCQVINLWNCCILLVDLFESYDDARTCEHQILMFLCLVEYMLLKWNIYLHIQWLNQKR